MSHKQLVEVCNFPEATYEIDKLITNRLPICISWVTRYVADEYNIDNETGVKTVIGKLYKQGANGTVVNTAPVNIGLATDWYCAVSWADVEFIEGCEYQNNIFNQLKFTNYEKENMEKMCMYDWSSSFCGNGFECQ